MAETNDTSLLGQQGSTEGQGDSSLLGAQAKAPESAPAAQAPAADANTTGKEGEGKTEAKSAPEKYADFKLPEGMALDTAVVTEFAGVAKQLGLTQENAQKLVDLQAKAAQNYSNQILEEFNKTTNTWKEESKKALGQEFQKELGYAAKALDKFGSPELRTILDETGLGNHPEIVKAFVKVGKLISEASFVEGQRQNQTKTVGEIFYPTMKK